MSKRRTSLVVHDVVTGRSCGYSLSNFLLFLTAFSLLSLPEFGPKEGATMKSPFDILEKIDEVNFRWLDAAQDLQSAKFQIEERQALSPGEYVIFDRRTQQIVAKSNSTLRCAVLPPKH